MICSTYVRHTTDIDTAATRAAQTLARVIGASTRRLAANCFGMLPRRRSGSCISATIGSTVGVRTELQEVVLPT